MNERRKSTFRLTFCAMMCALGVVLLYVGSVVEVLDIAVAAMASLLTVLVVIEYGGAWPWVVFGVTGLLSLLLLPAKLPAMMYVLFFGYYPIVKEKLEAHCRRRTVQWIGKELVFNVSLAVMLVLSRLFFSDDVAESMIELVVIFVVMAEVAFVLFDIAMTRLISLYLYRLRNRFRMGKRP